MSDTLDKILDLAPATNSTSTIDTTVVQGEIVSANTEGALVPADTSTALTTVSPDEKTLNEDFEFARTGLRDMISKGREALDSAIMLAQSSDQPRGFEVVGKMLEAIVNANKELMEIHRTKQETKAVPVNNGSLLPKGEDGKSPININQAVVFTGRASDMLRELRALEKRTKEDEEKTDASES